MDAFDSKTVSRIAGVSLRQIQYWDERGFVRPSVKLPEGRGTKRLYSFFDLVRLKVVKDLTEHGLSLNKVQECLHYLKRCSPDKVGSLDGLRYLTDGEKLFVLTRDRNKILDVMDRRFVLSLGIGSLVRQLHGDIRRLNGGSIRMKRRGAEGKGNGSA